MFLVVHCGADFWFHIYFSLLTMHFNFCVALNTVNHHISSSVLYSSFHSVLIFIEGLEKPKIGHHFQDFQDFHSHSHSFLITWWL